MAQILHFSLTSAVCAIALVLQCAVLLYGTWSEGVNTVAALVVLITVEVLPGSLLVRSIDTQLPANHVLVCLFAFKAYLVSQVYSMRQPRLVSGWKDALWCFFYNPNKSASGSGSGNPGSTTSGNTPPAGSAYVAPSTIGSYSGGFQV